MGLADFFSNDFQTSDNNSNHILKTRYYRGDYTKIKSEIIDVAKKMGFSIEEINDDYIEGFVALTGPSHAEEVVMQKLTVIAAASENIDLAKKVQVMFSNHSNFRVYALNDLVGAELGGSLKNIYALASGICEGLGFGVNARAAMISRALVEMKRLCLAMGAKEETLYGLTGVGDLIVTCTSNFFHYQS